MEFDGYLPGSVVQASPYSASMVIIVITQSAAYTR